MIRWLLLVGLCFQSLPAVVAAQSAEMEQGKRLFAIMKSKGRETEDVQSFIKSQYGYSHSREILRDDYEEIIEWIESDN